MGALRVAGRFVSGKELDGKRRTDARFRTPGHDTLPGVRPHEVWAWHYLPRGKRAMIRCGGLGLACLLLVSAWSAPDQTWIALQGLGVLGFLVFVYWVCTKLANHEILDRWDGPLAVVLAARWNFTPPDDPSSWITSYEDSRTNPDHPVGVKLPPTWREAQRAREQSAKIIAERRGMKTHDWYIDHDAGPRPIMYVRAEEVPPDKVLFDDVREALDRSGDGYYFLGLGLAGAEVWADLNGDGPHWVWSCGTGAGKTTAGRNVAAQVRKEGGRVVIFDPVKAGDSHADWIYDEDGHSLPDIEHYTTVEAMHEALIALGAERQRRSHLATQAKQFRRDPPEFQRILIVLEEQNGAFDMLSDYWKYLRKQLKAIDGEDQPETSPAMTALKVLIYAGRSARMHCFVSCQRFDAKIVGGGDVRGNFMVRMLARFDDHARRMLIPDIDPKPKSSGHLGRAIACMDGVATPFQGVLMEPDEARDWSSQDRPLAIERAATSELGHEQATAVCRPDQQEQVSDLGPRTALDPSAQPPRRKMTIKQAIEEGVVSGTESAVARMINRHGFPEKRGRDGKADTYFEDELALLEERRVRKVAMSR